MRSAAGWYERHRSAIEEDLAELCRSDVLSQDWKLGDKPLDGEYQAAWSKLIVDAADELEHAGYFDRDGQLLAFRNQIERRDETGEGNFEIGRIGE